MSEEKQIEEMAKIIDDNHGFVVSSVETAKTLYTAGYRKQSEGEWIYHECVASYDGAISGYSCSCCCRFVDENIFDMDEFNKNFCGNCGAKMKG